MSRSDGLGLRAKQKGKDLVEDVSLNFLQHTGHAPLICLTKVREKMPVDNCPRRMSQTCT